MLIAHCRPICMLSIGNVLRGHGIFFFNMLKKVLGNAVDVVFHHWKKSIYLNQKECFHNMLILYSFKAANGEHIE